MLQSNLQFQHTAKKKLMLTIHVMYKYIVFSFKGGDEGN